MLNDRLNAGLMAYHERTRRNAHGQDIHAVKNEAQEVAQDRECVGTWVLVEGV